MNKYKTALATINYNGSKDTCELIESLLLSKESFDLVVVDNKSPKEGELATIEDYLIEKGFGVKQANESFLDSNTSEYARTYHHCETGNEVVCIQSRENGGFAKGTNIGLKYALQAYKNREFIGIINNDTIVTESFISKIEDRMKSHSLLAAMGTILYYGYEHDYVWSIGGKPNWKKGQCEHFEKNQIFDLKKQYPEIFERGFISGCFTIFKTSALIEIGLLDEDYFFAGEEYQYSVDLCKKGKIAWIPDSIIYHKSKLDRGNGSSHNIKTTEWQYNAYLTKIVFVNKNKGLLFKLVWRAALLAHLQLKVKKKFDGEGKANEFKVLYKALKANLRASKYQKTDFENFKGKLCAEKY